MLTPKSKGYVLGLLAGRVLASEEEINKLIAFGRHYSLASPAESHTEQKLKEMRLAVSAIEEICPEKPNAYDVRARLESCEARFAAWKKGEL